MPAIQAKKFNWIRKLSAWEEAQAWRAKRRAMVEDFETNNAMLANAYSTAQANLISGSATLAIEAATARIQATAKAKINTLI
jgi:hypothetical protein